MKKYSTWLKLDLTWYNIVVTRQSTKYCPRKEKQITTMAQRYTEDLKMAIIRSHIEDGVHWYHYQKNI